MKQPFEIKVFNLSLKGCFECCDVLMILCKYGYYARHLVLRSIVVDAYNYLFVNNVLIGKLIP